LLAIKSNNHYVYLAMGRPWISVGLGAVQIAVLVPLVAADAARSGALGAAVGSRSGVPRSEGDPTSR